MQKSIVRRKRFWILAGLTVILAVCCRDWLPLLLNQEALVQCLNIAEPWRSLAFVSAHIIATALGIPGTILVLVGGAIFGLVWGTLWSVIGATLGAIAAFALARYLLHNWFKQRFDQHPLFVRLNRIVGQRSLRCVLTLRLAPISPFNLVNFLFGLSAVPLRPYALGTFFGIIPGTLAYTWIGITGRQAIAGEKLWPLTLALSLLVLLSLLPVWVRWQSSRAGD
ncbi:MAG: TVP38/TMEM64 family protein [Leptolyngbyaceae cyanobacterium RM1_1_2]|nr:TVP38/TMEM64 family protein [Leptolyngbyaceae cyanobacterium RM1_1_2]